MGNWTGSLGSLRSRGARRRIGPRIRPRPGSVLLLLAIAVLATGCGARSLMPSVFGPRLALSDLRMEVAREANDNTPLKVELVATSDEQLLAKLLTLSAAQWFDPAANFRRDYPTTLHAWDYELTPGSTMQLKPAPFAGTKAAGLVLFANYKGKGAYRLRLDPYRRATVSFGALDATVDGTR